MLFYWNFLKKLEKPTDDSGTCINEENLILKQVNQITAVRLDTRIRNAGLSPIKSNTAEPGGFIE